MPNGRKLDAGRVALQPLTKVSWYTTPEALRALARYMEEKWNVMLPGDSSLVLKVYGTDVELKIHVDQAGMEREAR